MKKQAGFIAIDGFGTLLVLQAGMLLCIGALSIGAVTGIRACHAQVTSTAPLVGQRAENLKGCEWIEEKYHDEAAHVDVLICQVSESEYRRAVLFNERIIETRTTRHFLNKKVANDLFQRSSWTEDRLCELQGKNEDKTVIGKKEYLCEYTTRIVTIRYNDLLQRWIVQTTERSRSY